MDTPASDGIDDGPAPGAPGTGAGRSLWKDFARMLSSRVVVLVTAFAISIFISRKLGPSGAGVYAALIAVPLLLVTLAESGVRQACVYHVGRKTFDVDRIAATVLGLLITSSISGMVIGYVIFRFTDSTDYPLAMILVALSLLPLQLVRKYTDGVFIGTQKLGVFSRLNSVSSLITLGCVVVFLSFLEKGVLGALLATAAGYAFTAVYGLVIYIRHFPVRPRYDREIAKTIYVTGLSYAFALFINGLNYRAGVLFLQKFSDKEQIGYYATAFTIAQLIWEIPAVLGVIVFSKSASAGDPRDFSLSAARLFRVALVVCTFCGLIASVGAPFFIQLLYGKKFLLSTQPLKILVLGVVALISFKVLNFDLAGRGKPWVSLWSTVPGLIVSTVLCYLWIPTRGAEGAAWATTIGFCVVSVLFLVAYARATGLAMREVLTFSTQDWNFLGKLARRFKPR